MAEGTLGISLTSSEFSHETYIPARFTCEGENINPGLTISNAPPKAKSLVLIVDDPDAAQEPAGNGETFVHWVVFNIDPTTQVINENSVPEVSIQGQNSRGKITYTGPCPPTFAHRYYFRLYALRIELDLPAGVSALEVKKAMQGQVIEQAELIGLYQKTLK